MNLKFCFLLISALLFTGCSANLFSYKGNTVTRQDRIIQLQPGDHQGIWKTNEVAIQYRYQMTPDSLTISGNVQLVGGFLHGFSTISRMVVQLFLLDDQGKIVTNNDVFSIGNHRSVDTTPMLFEKTIPLPQECRSISFAYDGALMDAGDGASGINIWYFPS